MVRLSQSSKRIKSSINPSNPRRFPVTYVITTLICSILSYYTGYITSITSNTACPIAVKNREQEQSSDEKIMAIVEQRVKAELTKASAIKTISENNKDRNPIPYFGSKTTSFATGMAHVKKKVFDETFDYGLPSSGYFNDEDAIILYTDSSIPSKPETLANTKFAQGIHKSIDIHEATENCDTMNVVIISKKQKQCVAIMEGSESYHVQRWTRPSRKLPLRASSRGQSGNRTPFTVPDKHKIKNHWGMLKQYLISIDDVLAELGPIAEKVAIDNTIIVLTCNMGQSELLMNFVCNAVAKGFEMKNILVFPTDKETQELAEGLGLTTYYDERNFEKLPVGEAKGYGDKNFVAMMYAKVVCVQLISMLGYDLLFQDVDVVWYKNPLEYFQNSKNEFYDFDMYFQDDGARSSRYAPLSANSGFYFVRNNEKTRYLFTSLLYAGDIIEACHSHQQVLIQLLNEHSSYFGLRVKVLDRDSPNFPGGWHYHRKKDLMKKIMKEEVTPYIFHMSWTHNKNNKLKFFQQMGEWYLNDKCINKSKSIILKNTNGGDTDSSTPLKNQCCLKEPKITCHYRDKPSKIPCKKNDPIDKGKPSFW